MYYPLNLIALTAVPFVLSSNYIPDYLPSSPCQQIDGGDWILVRHADLTNAWHLANDQLTGTSYYGGFGGSSPTSYPNDPAYPSSYSIPFDFMIAKPTKILFSDEKCNEYLVTRYEEIECDAAGASPYFLDNIIATSVEGSNLQFEIYSRCAIIEDPYITLGHHTTDLLYVGGSKNIFPGRRVELKYSNVWIQLPGISNTLGSTPSIYSPNGYINIPEYVFYGTTCLILITFISLIVCIVKSKRSGNKIKYQSVSMNSNTDIEN